MKNGIAKNRKAIKKKTKTTTETKVNNRTELTHKCE